MTRNRWAGLAVACFVLWLVLVIVLQLSFFGLILAAGFFGGRSVCAHEITNLHYKLWKAKLRQDDMTQVLSSAADRMYLRNTGEVPVIDKQPPDVVE